MGVEYRYVGEVEEDGTVEVDCTDYGGRFLKGLQMQKELTGIAQLDPHRRSWKWVDECALDAPQSTINRYRDFSSRRVHV